MRHIISFSGGKDSTALILWAKENLPKESTQYVFCDTGWEHDITYEYVKYINMTLLDGQLITLKSSEYDGFEDMAIKRGRVPSTKARFCTETLKIHPMIDWILEQGSDLKIYQGIRREESKARSIMKKSDEYFIRQIQWRDEGKGSEYRKKYRKPYRQNDIEEYLEDYDVDVERPIIDWKWDKVFGIMKKHEIEPNPLYREGFGRVGCFPCIMCRVGEIKEMALRYPERVDRIRELEKKLGRSFFAFDKVPDHFAAEPMIDDVVAWVTRHENDGQLTLFGEGDACVSLYNLCE